MSDVEKLSKEEKDALKKGRYLRHRVKGTIYGFNPLMVDEQGNADVEEITAEEAYPELFAPKTAKNRKSTIKLDTPAEEVAKAVEAPVKTDPALASEAAKGFGG